VTRCWGYRLVKWSIYWIEGKAILSIRLKKMIFAKVILYKMQILRNKTQTKNSHFPDLVN